MSIGLGPIGPGECTESQIQGISNVFASTSELFNPQAFVNPQLINIANMSITSTNTRQEMEAYEAYLLALQPPPPDLAILLQQVHDFEQKLVDFDYFTQRFQIWTNFISGTSGQYPEGGWAGLNTAWIFGGYDENGVWQDGANPAFVGVLAGFTFLGLWGAAKGYNQGQYTKCQHDPNDPCAGINKILGSILGLTDTLINAAISGMNQMIDFAANILDYITQMIGYVESLVATIAQAISELINTIISAIRDGLSRLLDKLKIDPCLGGVISSCAGPDLAAALSI